MVDSINGIGGGQVSDRSRAVSQVVRLRDPTVLTAIQQTEQRSSGATAPVRVFEVAQSSKSGAAMAKMPRGSLVDLLV